MSGLENRTLDIGTRLLVWLACGLMFSLALLALYFRGRITASQLTVGFLVMPLLLHLMASATVRFVGGFGSGMTTALLATRGEPHSREYSEQQALIAAGRYHDAVESFGGHLVAFPDDIEGHLRLAALLAGPAGDPIAAEQRYLAVRGMQPNHRQETVIGNGLIDLYRTTGQPHLLKTELARFGRLHAGTEAGEHARRVLREIVSTEGNTSDQEQ